MMPMSLAGTRLLRTFYFRPTLDVARDLLYKTLVYEHPDGLIAADIVEVEAYIGEDDPACHAAPGKTGRNAIMYGPGGYAYIYFIYGMYHCFNIVTERSGFPAAVLVRAAEPVAGVDLMRRNSPPSCRKPTDGPGKLCRAFGLTREQNGLDLTAGKLYLLDRGKKAAEVMTSRRIGIKKAIDRRWRFFDAKSPFISRR